MKASKSLVSLLCASMMLTNIIPVFAADSVAGSTNQTFDYDEMSDQEDVQETIVLCSQGASYFVRIPKVITLGSDKKSAYSVQVSGDISGDTCVQVAPVDAIESSEASDFYMKDKSKINPKKDVTATITHVKSSWNFEEVADEYEEAKNEINAPDLSSGNWGGTFDFYINLHTHTYDHGTCTGCGEEDANYCAHDYEITTGELTCTTGGEITYTCALCGDSYIAEEEPLGHNFESVNNPVRVKFDDNYTGNFGTNGTIQWNTEMSANHSDRLFLFAAGETCRQNIQVYMPEAGRLQIYTYRYGSRSFKDNTLLQVNGSTVSGHEKIINLNKGWNTVAFSINKASNNDGGVSWSIAGLDIQKCSRCGLVQ